uniref:Innexin n=1 Tax=Onchocerca volvulus TaxID=6282 RepID=A0A8R1U2P1_ONCVO
MQKHLTDHLDVESMIQSFNKYLRNLKPKYDDDVVDRCNYLLTNIMLLICAITVAAKQYVGEPLQCWVPAEFQSSWEQYIENFCFVESTYFVPFVDDMPMRTKIRENSCVNAQQITYVMDFNRRKNQYAKLMGKLTLRATPLRQIYVTALYLFCKCLNVLNIIVQLYLLNRFLGMQYHLWGFGVLNDLIHGREWSVSGNFPRVTFCDVTIREIGNTNRKTVQCVLMINMFNEKIFLALWFWLMALGILTVLNLAYWIVITFVPSYSKNFVSSYLTFYNIKPAEKEIDDFLQNSAGKDAITVLHLVSDNAGELVAADLFAALWRIFQEHPKLSVYSCPFKKIMSCEHK